MRRTASFAAAAALFEMLSCGSICSAEDGPNVSAHPVVHSAPVAWQTCPAPVHRVRETGIPNFGKLNACVWRSGQPTQEGFKRLAELGIKTVVNLRAESEQDKEQLPSGVNYVYIPVRDENVPTDEQAAKFLKVVSDPQNWPVLVHCHEGEGRAGIFAALVRYSVDGWDHNKIMRETRNFRLTHLGFIKPGMPANQKRFIEHWESLNPAGSYKPQSTAPKQ